MHNYPRIRELIVELDSIADVQIYDGKQWLTYLKSELLFESLTFFCATPSSYTNPSINHVVVSVENVKGFRTSDDDKPKLIPILKELKTLI